MQDDSVKKALSALAELGINVQPEDLPKLLPADPMEAAIAIMASVRAYFQGAYRDVPLQSGKRSTNASSKRRSDSVKGS